MPVPYPQDVLAHGEGSEGAQEVRTQHQEGLGGGGQLEEGAAKEVPWDTRHLLAILSLHVSDFGLSVYTEEKKILYDSESYYSHSTL